MWFWDAWEDPIKRPGQIFLFGKVAVDKTKNEYSSVCLKIDNVDRCVYLLPRQYVSKFRKICFMYSI